MAVVPSTELTRPATASSASRRSSPTARRPSRVAAAVAARGQGPWCSCRSPSKPSFSPLFTNLQPSDAANVTAKLTSDKVPYQLADNGSTILVPASDVDQERLVAGPGRPARHQHRGTVPARQGGCHDLRHDPAGRLSAGAAGRARADHRLHPGRDLVAGQHRPAGEPGLRPQQQLPDRGVGARRPCATARPSPTPRSSHRPSGRVERSQPVVEQRHRRRLQRQPPRRPGRDRRRGWRRQPDRRLRPGASRPRWRRTWPPPWDRTTPTSRSTPPSPTTRCRPPPRASSRALRAAAELLHPDLAEQRVLHRQRDAAGRHRRARSPRRR